MGQDEIRPFDGDLIFLGKIVVSVPLDLELSRLIALGHIFGLVDETVSIVACLSLKSLFIPLRLLCTASLSGVNFISPGKHSVISTPS